MLKINKVMALKIAGMVFSATGMVVSAIATGKSNEQHLEKFAEKYFENLNK